MPEGENSSRMEEMFCKMEREINKLRNAVKEKSASNLDGMIQRIYSPFTTEVPNCPLPPMFRLPQLESFDGWKDPLDHIKSFKTLVHLQMTPNKVMCRAFPTTLKGVTKVWFSKLSPNTIANFEQLNENFVRHFIGGQHHKKPLGLLLNIRQVEGESLR